MAQQVKTFAAKSDDPALDQHGGRGSSSSKSSATSAQWRMPPPLNKKMQLKIKK